jgi:hypothetical protein
MVVSDVEHFFHVTVGHLYFLLISRGVDNQEGENNCGKNPEHLASQNHQTLGRGTQVFLCLALFTIILFDHQLFIKALLY